MENGLILSEDQRKQMLSHILACLPEEACGLIAGTGNRAEAVLPVTNEMHSPYRFRMLPEEQLKAFMWLDEHNLDLLAVFHSHPTGPDHPSETDMAEFEYPGVITVIWTPIAGQWKMNGFQMDKENFGPVELIEE